MKNINKLIRHYVCEILIVILFVGISIPIWEHFDKSGVSKVANSYSTMDYLYLDIDKYIGYDTFADVVAVVNDTNTNRGYELIVKISKDLVSEDTVVKVNEETNLLNELKYNEDNEYNYYLIAKGNVVGTKTNYNVEFDNTDIEYNEVEYLIIENHDV